MHNDNVLWQKALELSDSLMSTDTLQPYRANYYYNRTLILSRLRHWKKYLHTQELYFMCLPEKNPDRLLFLGSKYMMGEKTRLTIILMKYLPSVTKFLAIGAMKIWLTIR